jgi:hypothetical protein
LACPALNNRNFQVAFVYVNGLRENIVREFAANHFSDFACFAGVGTKKYPNMCHELFLVRDELNPGPVRHILGECRTYAIWYEFSHNAFNYQ